MQSSIAVKKTFPAAVCLPPSLLAVLLLVYFTLSKVSILMPVCCAAVILVLTITSFLTSSRPLLVLTLLFCVAYFLFFLQHFVTAEVFLVPRLLPVAIILLAAALFLCLLLSAFHLSPYPKSLLIGLCLAGAVFVWETILQTLPHPSAAVRWTGGLQADPVLGLVPIPDSEMRTIYPNNPRGYFAESDSRLNLWWMHTGEGCSASLKFAKESDLVRIQIEKTSSRIPYDVQLNIPQFKVSGNERYVVVFEGRSDAPRTMLVGFSNAHAPWKTLGLSKEITLLPAWKRFEFPFKVTGNESNARIHFDMGTSDIDVELKSIGLRSFGGKIINPRLPPPVYEMDYRLNQLGCRGQDYAIPKPSGTRRVLVLGSSSAFGIGVREEDTVSARLEKLLNQGNNKSEVINCAVPGYSPLEDRILYERRLNIYDPDIVLLMLPRFLEDMKSAYFHPPLPPSRLERLFYTWSNTPAYPRQQLTPDKMLSTEEIVRLKNKLAAQDIRLVVVLTRMDADYSGHTESGKVWNMFTASLGPFLTKENILLFDTGRGFIHGPSLKELRVDPWDDQHPNEIAHKVFAQEIAKFLTANGMIR